MTKNWFKKFLPTHKTLSELPEMKGLRRKEIWRFNCQSVARGVAVGLFVAVLPIPLQMLLAAILAILTYSNLPIAVAFTWVSNPITFLPITYAIYAVGKLITGTNGTAITVESFHWQFESLSTLWSAFVTWISQFSKAFFVGLPIIAISAAVLGYLVVMLLWYANKWLHHYHKK